MLSVPCNIRMTGFDERSYQWFTDDSKAGVLWKREILSQTIKEMSKLLMKIASDPLEIIQNDLVAAMKEVWH